MDFETETDRFLSELKGGKSFISSNREKLEKLDQNIIQDKHDYVTRVKNSWESASKARLNS